MTPFEGKKRGDIPLVKRTDPTAFLPDIEGLRRIGGRGTGPIWDCKGTPVVPEQWDHIFLVGSGPSLSRVPPPLLERIRGRALCVNNSWRVVRGAAWVGGDRPHYFPDELWDCPDTTKYTVASYAEVAVGGRGIHRRDSVRFFVRGQAFNHPTFWTSGALQWGPPGGQKDSLGHDGTRSSFMMALRLCALIGAKRVYLVGCDFDAGGDRVYGTGLEVDRKHVPRMQRVFDVLKKRMRALVPTMPYKVWNCTEGSRIHTFEGMDLERALEVEAGRGDS